MTYTPMPRTTSATNEARARSARRQTMPAGQDPRRRILNDLVRAAGAYPLGASHLTTLEGLLFLLEAGTRTVFASNKVICKRVKGLAERSLSRHVARLAEVGFLRRVDSPNRKRYRRRNGKVIVQEFGFDLSPLFERAPEIAERARLVVQQQAMTAAARDRLSGLREQLEELGGDAALVAEIRRERRRVPCPATLDRLEASALSALAVLAPELHLPAPSPSDASKASPGPYATADLAANDSHSVRHQQSRKDRSTRHPNFEDRTEPSAVEVDLMVKKPRSLADAVRMDGLSMSFENSPKPGNESTQEAAQSSEAPQESVKDLADRVLAELRSKLSLRLAPNQTLHTSSQYTERGCGMTSSKSDEALTPLTTGKLQGLGSALTGLSVPSASASAGPRFRCADGGTPALLSIEETLAACPKALALAGDQPRCWSHLFEAAWKIGGWLGISEAVMAEACAALGRNGLAVTLFALCERRDEIHNPGGYLRALIRRPGFDPREMLAA